MSDLSKVGIDYSLSLSSFDMSCSNFRPVQAGIQEWKNKISIRSYPDSKAEDGSPLHVRRPEIQNLESSDTITSRLCYACHTTWTSKNIRDRAVRGMNIPVPIWASVHSMNGDVWARKRVDAQGMQAIIGDSLLDSFWWCMIHSYMVNESHCVSRGLRLRDYRTETRIMHSNSRKIFRTSLTVNTLSLIFANSTDAPGCLKTCSPDYLLSTVSQSINASPALEAASPWHYLNEQVLPS